MENKNIYLIPANSKKSMLILSLFNTMDIIILVSGIGLTFLLLIVFNGIQETWFKVVCAIPALTAVTLVAPLPYYHNVRTFAANIIRYFTSRKNYFWRGWCVKDEYRKSER